MDFIKHYLIYCSSVKLICSGTEHWGLFLWKSLNGVTIEHGMLLQWVVPFPNFPKQGRNGLRVGVKKNPKWRQCYAEKHRSDALPLGPEEVKRFLCRCLTFVNIVGKPVKQQRDAKWSQWVSSQINGLNPFGRIHWRVTSAATRL